MEGCGLGKKLYLCKIDVVRMMRFYELFFNVSSVRL